MNIKLTDAEIKSWLKQMVIVVDTRENKWDNIKKYLEKKKIPYIRKKLTSGDYSIQLPPNEKLGINVPIYFDSSITIERKASLEELSNNLTHKRDQFVNELIRVKGKVILLVEDGSWERIQNHDYNTNFGEKAYISTLHTFRSRYDMNIEFVSKEYAPKLIVDILFCHCRDVLKNKLLDKIGG